MPEQTQAEIRIGVKAETEKARGQLRGLGDEARGAGSRSASALGVVRDAARAAQGGVKALSGGLGGLGQAAAAAATPAGAALALVGVAAKGALEYLRACREEASRLADIRLGNLTAGLSAASDAARRERAELDLLDRRDALEAGVRDARAEAAWERDRADLGRRKEEALSAAGGDPFAAQRVEAEFAYRGAELASRAAAEASARAVRDMRTRRDQIADRVGAAEDERADLENAQREALAIALAQGGDISRWDVLASKLGLADVEGDQARREAAARAAEEAGRRMEQLSGEIAALRDEDKAVAERIGIEKARDVARGHDLDAARTRRDRALAGIDAAEAESQAREAAGADDVPAAAAAARSSPLSVASDAMRRIGAEAGGGGGDAVPRRLDALAAIAKETRDLMRRIEGNTRRPVAAFA